MNNIKILRTGIDVSKVLKQLKKYSLDWSCNKEYNHDSLLNYGFPHVDVGILNLKVGVVKHKDEFVGNSEISREVPEWNRHTAVRSILKKNGFPKLERCGFLSMPVGGHVGRHIDVGDYYLSRNRYHLAIQGKYLYTCGQEECIIQAGDLFWFDNKLEHSATNISDEVRITFVFDVLK